MKQNVILFSCALTAATLLGGCSYRYMGVSQRSCIVIDSRYDAHPDAQAATFMKPYKARVDSLMGPVVGKVARNLNAYQPESELSNLLSDIMVWGGKLYGEKPDFGVYNMGGIRASLIKGNVTYGDILDVAPFENKICFLTLNGTQVLQIFREMTAQGGQGLSHSVRLVMTHDGKLVSAKINGADVDPERDYRIATIDYVAQGNDKMNAFKLKRDLVSPQDESNNARNIIVKYFQEQTAKGQTVDAQVEGRIKIE